MLPEYQALACSATVQAFPQLLSWPLLTQHTVLQHGAWCVVHCAPQCTCWAAVRAIILIFRMFGCESSAGNTALHVSYKLSFALHYFIGYVQCIMWLT